MLAPCKSGRRRAIVLSCGCRSNADLVDWQHLYYKENYLRLQRVKKEWDPHNIFHHGQSIELP